MSDYYIGLMSGTSIDAIDVAIARFPASQRVEIIATHTHPIPIEITQSILSLCQPGENEIDRMGKLDHELGVLFSDAVIDTLKISGLQSHQVIAIGSHGQTIRHRPDVTLPFTLQIGNPAIICQNCDITTAADFRRADMAAGGQGAPLAPAFHQAFFSHHALNRVILNVGGMANITILSSCPDEPVRGFDTGPGNVLLNAWIKSQRNLPYDESGQWSASEAFDEALLSEMLSHPYFEQAPPKSTGRETFDWHWLKSLIDGLDEPLSASVVQSTLCELSAISICDAIKKSAPKTDEIFICGGGAHNADLISRIEKRSNLKVKATCELGVDVDFVEATAFAWFAQQALNGVPANLPAVTGAERAVILGAIYPR